MGVERSFPQLAEKVRKSSVTTQQITCIPGSSPKLSQQPFRRYPVRGSIEHSSSSVPSTLSCVTPTSQQVVPFLYRPSRTFICVVLIQGDAKYLTNEICRTACDEHDQHLANRSPRNWTFCKLSDHSSDNSGGDHSDCK